MNRIFFVLFAASALLLFAFNGALLDAIHWQYSTDDGPFFTRIHPATYVLLVTSAMAIGTAPRRVWKTVTAPALLFYLIAALILLLRAIAITLKGITAGELTTVLTNFITPALILVCATRLSAEDLQRMVIPLRVFFVINSLMGVAERLVHHRFIPNFLDQTTDPRSTALVGHPLNGSLLTGLLIVYLVTARRGDAPIWSRLPELAVHAAGMFAFGGRSALIFTPTVLVLSSIMGKQQQKNQADLTILQRALPILVVLAGICLIFLPIDFVDATLDRFTNDHNSSQQRNSAIGMLTTLSFNDILFGINIYKRTILMGFYQAVAIELCWAALTITYGLVFVLPMMAALPVQLFTMARKLDRSAFYMSFLFLVVTAGSLSIGVKSLLVSELFLMLLILAQPYRPARTGSLFGDRFAAEETKRRRVSLFDDAA